MPIGNKFQSGQTLRLITIEASFINEKMNRVLMLHIVHTRNRLLWIGSIYQEIKCLEVNN